jgi:hypothetical protein
MIAVTYWYLIEVVGDILAKIAILYFEADLEGP